MDLEDEQLEASRYNIYSFLSNFLAEYIQLQGSSANQPITRELKELIQLYDLESEDF